MLAVTAETKEQIPFIRQVVTDAFGRRNEAELIEVIRESDNFIPELSLVAVDGENVVGHILFSPIVIEASGRTTEALALAPIAVTPLRQNQGIGSQLIRTGLSKCGELDYKIIVVLGEPAYYGRFGFQTASKFGIKAPFVVPDEAFMALEVKSGALNNVTGTVQYPSYFQEV